LISFCVEVAARPLRQKIFVKCYPDLAEEERDTVIRVAYSAATPSPDAAVLSREDRVPSTVLVAFLKVEAATFDTNPSRGLRVAYGCVSRLGGAVADPI